MKNDKMLSFNSIDGILKNEELQQLGKYDHKKVLLNGDVTIVSGTNMKYEDIIWGKAHEVIEELNEEYELNMDSYELASIIRDNILGEIEKNYKVNFVDMYDEY